MSLWNCQNAKELWHANSSHDDQSRYQPSLTFTEAGRSILTGDALGNFTVWQAHTGRELANLNEFDGRLEAIAFSDHGNYLCAIYNNRLLVIDNNRSMEQAR